MNPKRFGSKANQKQEPWKVPLPQFIERLYFKRFRKNRPDTVRSIEQVVKDKKRKQAERKERKRIRKLQESGLEPEGFQSASDPGVAGPRTG